jgi:hypothetical protein
LAFCFSGQSVTKSVTIFCCQGRSGELFRPAPLLGERSSQASARQGRASCAEGPPGFPMIQKSVEKSARLMCEGRPGALLGGGMSRRSRSGRRTSLIWRSFPLRWQPCRDGTRSHVSPEFRHGMTPD